MRKPLLAICLACVAASTTPLPPMPPMPKPALLSPKDAGSRARILKPAFFVPPKPKLVTVGWNYTNGPSNWASYINFEVWRSGFTYVTNHLTGVDTNGVPFQYDAVTGYLTNWTLFQTTTNLYAVAGATNDAGFFRVRAHNLVNNTYSDWGTR